MQKHGMSRSRVYRIWIDMKSRCMNPKHPKFYMYGARGIYVCERWLIFTNFLSDMGEPPSAIHSIDRYPNHKGPYEPTNCRWATPLQQASNTELCNLITWNGETHPVSVWARKLGMPKQTLDARLKRWPLEKAMTSPKYKHVKPHDGGWSKRKRYPKMQ